MEKDSRIYVAGHKGLAGSAIVRALKRKGYENILMKSREELDLIRQRDVEEFFDREKPEYVFCAAAKVGGIHANSTYPADFIYINTVIAANIIHCACRYKVTKLLNMGSSCIYPKMAPQPLKEEYLLTGELEPTNEPYAVAKIAAIKMCSAYNRQYGTDFISIMPTNLYGPGDSYDLENSHVLPALIRKFHDGKRDKKKVVLWGDGSPYREFLYSDDLAGAAVFLMESRSAGEIGEFVNIGTGEDIRIKELAQKISNIVGYQGDIEWDTSKPNGTPRKKLDISKMRSLGWEAGTSLEEGIRLAYRDFLAFLSAGNTADDEVDDKLQNKTDGQ